MAGIGQQDAGPLIGGVAAQPLVSPMAPAVNPDSVTALVDAFRKGAIGMADIQDRIGAEAMAQKRAHIQQLQEYVSPVLPASQPHGQGWSPRSDSRQ